MSFQGLYASARVVCDGCIKLIQSQDYQLNLQRGSLHAFVLFVMLAGFQYRGLAEIKPLTVPILNVSFRSKVFLTFFLFFHNSFIHVLMLQFLFN